VTVQYSDLQLDALRELANIGSGSAATSLSNLLGLPVDISVPSSSALSLGDAVDAVGPPDAIVTGVVIPVFGDLDGVVLLIFAPAEAATLCGLLGVDPADPVALSALGEVGNILGCAYVGALGTLAGMELEPRPPECVEDMLGAIVSTVLVAGVETNGLALMLDSKMEIEGVECSFAFVFVPDSTAVQELLTRLEVG
jgi:chemotaxis protein CheC